MPRPAYTPDEPIAAIATSLAPQALGVIRTSGKGAIELAARVFSRPKALVNAPTGTVRHGWIIRNGRPIDEVMAAVFRAPKSFTGEDTVEIYCHGGAAPCTGIYRLLLETGFRAAEPGEFTLRAFLHGKTDLTRAEAAAEIIAAKTDAARERACGRLAGALFEELRAVKTLLLHTLAALEAEIEYPEDENAIPSRFDDRDLREAEGRLRALLDSWTCEKLYQDGARVALCGRTNAGKSSLFNLLLKEDRSIVSNTPGTTRDWIESWTSFGGLPVLLYDTAGIRESEDPVEKAGVERTRDLLAQADALVYVIDGAQGDGPDGEDAAFIREAEAGGKPLVIALNKADRADRTGKPLPEGALWVSAKTGEGIPALAAAVQGAIEGAGPGVPAALGSRRQKDACAEALDSVVHALKAPSRGFTTDSAAADIEDALYALGEITGEVTAGDVLDTVFSTFCLGK
ncbi:MAG: tRNA uridine-5-carboxymethylaminomethyl(34) synthesis GTPase MnmE [Spirochaetaceae bacterium]|jgi:tRNA modification GTPase|nr:tRNA uridine-5-carboxymethylaminomethyl(34) synthesis GTPase MnmE [Spirochaetaceae bacterium]